MTYRDDDQLPDERLWGLEINIPESERAFLAAVGFTNSVDAADWTEEAEIRVRMIITEALMRAADEYPGITEFVLKRWRAVPDRLN